MKKLMLLSLLIGGLMTVTTSLVAEEIKYPTRIENHDFETGNLDGWTIVSGELFVSEGVNSSVTSEKTWWAEEIPYNQEGNYHLNGWKGGGEGAVGRLRSSTFNLQGSGWITFKLGGAKDLNKQGIEVFDADTGKLVAKYGNDFFNDKNFPHLEKGLAMANMLDFKADLSKYLGKNLYIEIVDEKKSDWGVVFVDDIETYNEIEPKFGLKAKNLKD